MTILLFVAGLVGMVVGADLLVRGASKLALSLGMSPLVVGLTIVALGTSAPEIAVSVSSALNGNPNLSIGNVVGSNIFNVLFILGVSAAITPLLVNAQIIRQEIPIMLAASLLLVVFALDLHLSAAECAVLLFFLLTYIVFLVRQSRGETKETKQEYADEIDDKNVWYSHWSAQIALVLVGLVLLVVGSNWLIEACVSIARAVGVSDLVIGLTILAAGTSMPEVATSVMAAIKGEKDIAVGNVIGSNTFNILGCLGVTGIVAPLGIAVSPAVLNVDIWVMLAAAFVCIPIMLPKQDVSRISGIWFVSYYVVYVVFLVTQASGHPLAGVLTSTLLSVIVPSTILYVLFVFLRNSSKGQGSPSR